MVDRFCRFFGIAGFVGILDPQDKFAAVMSRKQPVEECRARAADVQVTGRRWRKANANFGIHCFLFSHRFTQMKHDSEPDGEDMPGN